jgi:hypothetical protein
MSSTIDSFCENRISRASEIARRKIVRESR